MRRSSVSSGWKETARNLPWRAMTMPSSIRARTLQFLEVSVIRGARMNTPGNGRSKTWMATGCSKDSFCLPKALRRTSISIAFSKVTSVGSASRFASRTQPAHVPRTAMSSSEIRSRSFGPIPLCSRIREIVVLSPPGRITPSNSGIWPGVRRRTPFPLILDSRKSRCRLSRCSETAPWIESTPMVLIDYQPRS